MAQSSLSGVLTSVKPITSLLGSPLRLSLNSSLQNREHPIYPKDTRFRGPLEPLPLKQRIPPRTWDTHMHVVEPQRYPVSAAAIYQPSPHTLDEAIAFESSLGIENFVLVQPSIYGTDNSCLLEALRQVGSSHGRGVVVIDPATIEADTLTEWHSLGVRGVRVNLKSVGKVLSEQELTETLMQHAEVVRPLDWIIQVYISLDMVPMLERIAPQLGVKVCIDHFGAPNLLSLTQTGEKSFDPYSLRGFSSLISLLRGGDTYVKISAPYRFTNDKEMRDLETIIREFLREAPDRVLYATDWPHTRFSAVDIEPFTELCLRLCGDVPGLAERVFRQNAEDLMDGRRR
ncbi:hypothetical protein EYZ11_011094 [Aspergillus tanneri]|uniref:Amidohydrolase-related domain-containing protein n=1 Tax=Aspergillus tanneri TaxID=1220188 RepID=A0A4S3J499_9EURO|nr:uncharacterized protein ATNIH1004_000343 [Aspergillus tanneri]KAA8651460.1 hypothetical protein ATNIH1004_000343 [Aspergillus tanneri]THC89452.1 hypothetical protein EYZ11_011094 [Aspergillus tanneri]